jgi:ElaB/YqjD/DUF883 family membrane-anchored ribosome-binding protein
MAASNPSPTPSPTPAAADTGTGTDTDTDTDDAGTPATTGSAPADWIERAAGSAHHAIDKVAEQAAPRVRRLRSRLNDAGQRLHSGSNEISALSNEWAESARCTVREQPLTALAIAAAVGWLLGRLSR